MSSAFWLGDRCKLGLEGTSKTTSNLKRTKQCVLHLPSDNMSAAVNALARTTGEEDVPEAKLQRGYRYEKNKFEVAKLTPQPSENIDPPRSRECPVQMEAELVGEYEVLGGFVVVFAVQTLSTYVVEGLRLSGYENRIDSDAWRPMIMSFQHLYGLRERRVGESELAAIEEELYRVPKKRMVGAGPDLPA